MNLLKNVFQNKLMIISKQYQWISWQLLFCEEIFNFKSTILQNDKNMHYNTCLRHWQNAAVDTHQNNSEESSVNIFLHKIQYSTCSRLINNGNISIEKEMTLSQRLFRVVHKLLFLILQDVYSNHGLLIQVVSSDNLNKSKCWK